MALFLFLFSFEDVVEPAVVCGLVLDNAQKERVVRIPKNVLGYFEYQHVVRVIVFNIFEDKFGRFYIVLPRVRPQLEWATEAFRFFGLVKASKAWLMTTRSEPHLSMNSSSVIRSSLSMLAQTYAE